MNKKNVTAPVSQVKKLANSAWIEELSEEEEEMLRKTYNFDQKNKKAKF